MVGAQYDRRASRFDGISLDLFDTYHVRFSKAAVVKSTRNTAKPNE